MGQPVPSDTPLLQSAAPEPSVSDPTEGQSTRGLFMRVFPSICLPMFMAAVDATIVATALPAIAGTLGDVERISWVVVSYLMATTIAAPVYGRLGDALGRKRLLFLALGVFVAASVGCAAAPTLLWLVAARVLQGFGGGGLMTLSQALVGETVPPRERGRYQGYLASIFMTASTFGPVAGGWLTQHLGWQSVFLINMPLGLIAAVLAVRLPDRRPTRSRMRFDWLGLILFSGFVVPLLMALERGAAHLRHRGAGRGRAGGAVGGVAAAAVAAGAAGQHAADPRGAAVAACDLARGRNGRLRRRHRRVVRDVHADLLAGGARGAAGPGGAAAAAVSPPGWRSAPC